MEVPAQLYEFVRPLVGLIILISPLYWVLLWGRVLCYVQHLAAVKAAYCVHLGMVVVTRGSVHLVVVVARGCVHLVVVVTRGSVHLVVVVQVARGCVHLVVVVVARHHGHVLLPLAGSLV